MLKDPRGPGRAPRSGNSSAISNSATRGTRRRGVRGRLDSLQRRPRARLPELLLRGRGTWTCSRRLSKRCCGTVPRTRTPISARNSRHRPLEHASSSSGSCWSCAVPTGSEQRHSIRAFLQQTVNNASGASPLLPASSRSARSFANAAPVRSSRVRHRRWKQVAPDLPRSPRHGDQGGSWHGPGSVRAATSSS